ncbi:MAG: polysaccharide biosynthesis protein [Phycisphaerae bacterium]|nr:polysaccharide biosynthesis protein [Phycisphaerae bacterium]
MSEAQTPSEPTQVSDTQATTRLTWLEGLLIRHRLVSHVVIHTLLFALALLLAFVVRFDAGVPGGGGSNWFLDRFLPLLPAFLAIKLITFGQMKLFRGGWQYSSIRDVANIVAASWVSFAIIVCFVIVFKRLPLWTNRPPVPYVGPYFQRYPEGVVVLDFIATVFLVCTVRLGFRIYREELRPISGEGVTRVLVVGAGNAAEAIVREINRMRVERYRVVGIVDDDPNKQGLVIHGAPVLGGTEDIPHVCEEQGVDEIIIAIPSATRKQLQRVIDVCSGTKLKFQSLPGVGDLIDGRVTVSQMRPVDINDLLGREVVELDWDAIGRFIRGRRVLVTGAGGSIGSEMCRQIAHHDPAALILVEQAETPLFDIDNELRAAFPQLELTAVVCDIYDRDRVFEVWEEHRPDVVIHAAAHKHVPLMEQNPCEAVKNNILGSRNTADASCAYDTAEFVMISTDKAVNPSSVMGASKRVAEVYTQALNGRDGCKTQFKAVRFGNVLGSNGSVVPTFRRQIANGGPVTVTHPEMTRYFMTIPEAAQLVLQAAATGSGGQIFLLDMGEPVKIVDLARQMITLSGFVPSQDIDIVFSGIRPGEKLFEELRADAEDLEPTVHPKVRIWRCQRVTWPTVQRAMNEFEALANSTDRRKIVGKLTSIIPEYTPLNPPSDTSPSRAPAASQATSGQSNPATR